MRMGVTIKIQNAAVGATAGLAIVFTLTGCDANLSTGPVSIRQDGSSLLVAVCEAISPDLVLMEVRAPGGEWETFWRFSGDGRVEIPRGSVLSTDEAHSDPLGSEIHRDPNLYAHGELVVTLGQASPEQKSIAAAFKLDDLEAGQWLRGDGVTASEPCA